MSRQTDVCSSKRVRRVSIPGHEVDTDSIRPRGNKEHQRHGHGDCGTILVRRVACERGCDGAADDAADDPARTALSVAAEAAHTQRNDGWEADRLKEERHCQQAEASVIALRDGRRDEDDATGQEGEEHPARPDEVHKPNAEEAPECERPLRTGKELGAQGGVGAWTSVDNIVDEIAVKALLVIDEPSAFLYVI